MSNKFFLTLILCFSQLSFAQMDHSKMDHSKMNHASHGKKMQMDAKGKKSVDAETKKEIITVLEKNESLHNAFFKYSGAKVEKAANSMKASLDKVSNKEIKNLLKFAATKLDDIKASNKRDKNNQNYHIVSTALIVLINKYDFGNKYSGYHCPMVKKKWIQNTAKMEDIHNPYADNMPHCGAKL